MKKITVILSLFFALSAKSQKIDSIYFNLYTDSLKKGVHNYINVDGKSEAGTFFPLMSDEILFASTCGKWDGNSLIIDRESKIDSVIITASLKKRPEVTKNVTIYIKKIEAEPGLKTEKELIEQWRGQRKRQN